MKKFFLLIVLCIICSCVSKRQVLSAQGYSNGKIYVDKLNNIYLLTENGDVIRTTIDAEQLYVYAETLDGHISHIDVTNPQKIIAFIPDYGRVKILDNTLSLIDTWTIDAVEFSDVTVLASSNDGNYWLYDAVNWRLVKINKDGVILQESNRLTDYNIPTFEPLYIIERENHVYLSTSYGAVLVFDNFGTFQKSLPLEGISKFDVIGNQVIYKKNNTIYSFDQVVLEENSEQLPVEIQSVEDITIYKNEFIALTKAGLKRF